MPAGCAPPDSMKTFSTHHTRNIHSIDWSKDGKYLCTASEDAVIVWETTAFQQVHTTGSQISNIRFASFICAAGPVSDWIAIGQYESMLLWRFTNSPKVSSTSCQSVGGQTIVAVHNAHMGGNVICIASMRDPETGKAYLVSCGACKEDNLKLWNCFD
jgi:WD40 repeat protein